MEAQDQGQWMSINTEQWGVEKKVGDEFPGVGDEFPGVGGSQGA